MLTGDSDYVVEEYIKPTKVRKRIINDERADLLGNFDDDDNKFKKKAKKPKQIVESEENPFADADENENEAEGGSDNGDEKNGEIEKSDAEEETENSDAEEENEDDDDNEESSEEDIIDEAQNSDQSSSEPEANVPEEVQPEVKTKKVKPTEKNKPTVKKPEKKADLTDDQIKALIRGSSKQDRFVLYVTNINYSTTRETLTDFFSVAGPVKSVRVPKVRRSAFAFVEMSDIGGFKVRYTNVQCQTANLPNCFIETKLTNLIFNPSECLGFTQSNLR